MEEEIIIKEINENQEKTLMNLKENKEWIQIDLYKGGTVILIVREDVEMKVIPQGHIEKEFTLEYKNKSYFLNNNGEIIAIGLGITKWNDPIKTIIN